VSKRIVPIGKSTVSTNPVRQPWLCGVAAFAESLPTAFLSRTGRARIVSSPTPKLPPILNTAARFPEPDFFPRRNCAPTPSAR